MVLAAAALLWVLVVPALAAAVPDSVTDALPPETASRLEGLDEYADHTAWTEGLSRLWQEARQYLGAALREKASGAALLLGVVLLCGVAESFLAAAEQPAVPQVVPVAGALAITLVAAGDFQRMMGLGVETMEELDIFAKALLPTLSAAVAASGGIASASDITQGLPRVEELFEARKPKSVAVIAHNGGLVSFDKDNKGVDVVKVDDPQTGDHFEHQIVFGSKVRVHEGDLIEKGTMITEGSADPSEVLLVNGELSVQEYLIREVQMVYRTQGVDINDKHIEVIVRQMMKKVRIEEPGDTDYIRGMMADRAEVLHLNEQIDRENAEDGGSRQKATYTAILQGITKASLATDSFMSAASFQETTRVLTEAAIKGKVDPLQGLKENVIIGKLIPAGTGLVTYTEEEKAEEEADEANLEALMASTNAIVM